MMDPLIPELKQVEGELSEQAARGEVAEVTEPLQRLEDAAARAAKAWSGSNLGYQANVYYADLAPRLPALTSVRSGVSTGCSRELPVSGASTTLIRWRR